MERFELLANLIQHGGKGARGPPCACCPVFTDERGGSRTNCGLSDEAINPAHQFLRDNVAAGRTNSSFCGGLARLGGAHYCPSSWSRSSSFTWSRTTSPSSAPATSPSSSATPSMTIHASCAKGP